MSDTSNYLMFSLKILFIIVLFSAAIFLLCTICLLPVTVASPVNNFSSDVQVVIDPGHGGKDGGAVSKSGLLEKDLNLSVSSTFNDILILCGIDTVMTRSDDKLVCDENDPALKGKVKLTDLKNRLSIGKDNPSAVFISVHMNTFPEEKYNGLQIYFSPNNENSFFLAKSIQDDICRVMQNDNNRKVKKAGSNIYLLDRMESPAILIECGFLSNIKESQKLATSEYQTQLSLVFSKTVLEFLSENSNN